MNSTASSPVSAPKSAAPAPVPRLGLGPLGIAVRTIVAVGILTTANFTVGLVPAALSVIPGAVELFSGSSPWGFVLAFVLQLLVLSIVVLGVWAWMRWVERTPIRAAGWCWGPRSILWLLLGVIIAAGSLLAVVVLLPSTGPVPDPETLLGEQTTTPVMVALLIVYYLGLAFIQQSIPEELLFRGWLLWRMRHRPVLAIVVTTLTFTMIHLISNGGQQSIWEHVLYLALPFGFALLAVSLLLWTGSLWTAVGVHGGFHIGNYLATVALPQVDTVASWFAIGGVQTVLGLTLTVTAMRRGKRILNDGN